MNVLELVLFILYNYEDLSHLWVIIVKLLILRSSIDISYHMNDGYWMLHFEGYRQHVLVVGKFSHNDYNYYMKQMFEMFILESKIIL